MNRVQQLLTVYPFPLPFIIILDIQYFALAIATVNRAFGHIRLLEVVHKYLRNPLNKPTLANILHIVRIQFYRLHEIRHIHRVLTLLIQEHIDIECLIIGIIRHIPIHREIVMVRRGMITNIRDLVMRIHRRR